jgi:DNA-binding NtrC family response regulator
MSVEFSTPKRCSDMAYAPRILVIEDEPGVLTLFESVLTEDGYAVIGVKTARHALSIVRDTSVDLAILDMSLPDGDGPDVIRQLIEEVPYLKVLAGSGGMGQVLQTLAMRAGAAATFGKPIAAHALRRVVYEVLDPSCAWLSS